jgi:glycosyltransferase involved in cell wall biosynthesis
MSKIVIDAREWNTSTGRYISNLVRQLEKLDTKNNYIVLMKPNDLSSWVVRNTNFVKLSCPWKEFTFGEQLGFKRQLDSLDAELVHFGMSQQPILYRGKSLTTVHDLTTLRFINQSKNHFVFKARQQVYKYVVSHVLRKSAAIIVPSQFVKNDITAFSGINPEKINITYEAADQIVDKPQPFPFLKDEKFLMYVGRPMIHKNLQRLVEAFSSLQTRHPELKLVLAGKQDANYEQLTEQVERKEISNVIFTGFVSEGQLRWLYEHCLAYVFPSLSEGFGLPGLEAMLNGAPVISSNTTSLPEIYGDGAYYFDPLDVISMAKAINEVIVNKDLRASLIERGHIQAAKYSWQRLATQTLKVYESALNK